MLIRLSICVVYYTLIELLCVHWWWRLIKWIGIMLMPKHAAKHFETIRTWIHGHNSNELTASPSYVQTFRIHYFTRCQTAISCESVSQVCVCLRESCERLWCTCAAISIKAINRLVHIDRRITSPTSVSHTQRLSFLFDLRMCCWQSIRIVCCESRSNENGSRGEKNKMTGRRSLWYQKKRE